ncbi:outer membrane protein assembly factor BamA [Novimethylophilus kurashikiensis]|uniref:Outer membrane protein assembly factor BamA n=1 Tax=Novimethylophilus kurashikiensis TaxID=1825523 RepID=A0A2R5FBH9_9PROT|nr:hypothetical protein [Novimethylophilus kurashikiensis]GBG15385.1 outer membrane protein assembly factor BamA [Novimethylophilus kurashikiensis]
MMNLQQLIFLISFSLPVSALAANQIGDWVLNDGLEGVKIANVTNSDGSTAGVICNTNSCDAYFTTSSNRACDNGDKYPVLINSSVGAAAVNSVCREIGNIKIMQLTDTNAAISAFESGGDFGIALPLASGNFRSARFSTKGATQAIRWASTPSPVSSKPFNNKSYDETF